MRRGRQRRCRPRRRPPSAAMPRADRASAGASGGPWMRALWATGESQPPKTQPSAAPCQVRVCRFQCNVFASAIAVEEICRQVSVS